MSDKTTIFEALVSSKLRFLSSTIRIHTEMDKASKFVDVQIVLTGSLLPILKYKTTTFTDTNMYIFHTLNRFNYVLCQMLHAFPSKLTTLSGIKLSSSSSSARVRINSVQGKGPKEKSTEGKEKGERTSSSLLAVTPVAALSLVSSCFASGSAPTSSLRIKVRPPSAAFARPRRFPCPSSGCYAHMCPYGGSPV